jgi:hypothetical protein
MSVKKTKDNTKQLEATLARAKALRLNVGFPRSTAARNEGEIDNPTLAAIHTNGSPARNIPARPFLVPGIESEEKKLVKILEDGLKQALKQNAPDLVDAAYERTGQAAVGAVQRYMVKGVFAPLKPATIRRKGSSKPLIDTGQLRQAVSYEVSGG